MILFGAGSSVPFGIPGMKGFTDRFIEKFGESELIGHIRDSIDKSEKILGISFSFDLETLLSVLGDLSSQSSKKPISAATSCLLINLTLNITGARKKFGNEATLKLKDLTQFIFETCLNPIKRGKKDGTFSFLNDFYGPLLTTLNRVDLKNIQDWIKSVFSTNWDLCFKTWADYVNLPIRDGIEIDKQSQPVLNIEKNIGTSGDFHYLPLHGSLDLIKTKRLKGKGSYEDILKISDPLSYFEDKPENMRKAFMIYPLEAIGYEESIRSPYFDMLYHFRDALKRESVVFIIGYSLRDPIIGSIFEEVIAEKIRNGNLAPLSNDLDSRRKEAAKHNFKIFVFNPRPEKLAENLEKQYNNNLLGTFIPIKIEFPKVSDKQFHEKYQETIKSLIINLIETNLISKQEVADLTNLLSENYNFSIHY